MFFVKKNSYKESDFGSLEGYVWCYVCYVCYVMYQRLTTYAY